MTCCPHTYPYCNYYSRYDDICRFEFSEECTKECLQNQIKILEEDVTRAQAILNVYKSLKVSKNGTVPQFDFNDVLSYYSGSVYLPNPNIQDLFSVNILDLNFPGIVKRTDIPKSEEEKEEKENDGFKEENNVAVEEIKKN